MQPFRKYGDPQFPVVNSDPSVDDCIRSMRFRDWAVMVGITSGSWGYGYIMGKPLRGPTASVASAIGLTFASFVILQDTRGRLLGWRENAAEVKKYGISSPVPEPVMQDVRYPTATGMKSGKQGLNWKNLT